MAIPGPVTGDGTRGGGAATKPGFGWSRLSVGVRMGLSSNFNIVPTTTRRHFGVRQTPSEAKRNGTSYRAAGESIFWHANRRENPLIPLISIRHAMVRPLTDGKPRKEWSMRGSTFDFRSGFMRRRFVMVFGTMVLPSCCRAGCRADGPPFFSSSLLDLSLMCVISSLLHSFL